MPRSRARSRRSLGALRTRCSGRPRLALLSLRTEWTDRPLNTHCARVSGRSLLGHECPRRGICVRRAAALVLRDGHVGGPAIGGNVIHTIGHAGIEGIAEIESSAVIPVGTGITLRTLRACKAHRTEWSLRSGCSG